MSDARDLIAIVGMAGRFPGAPDLDRFWRNLREGVESVTFFSPGDPGTATADPSYVPARPVLEGIELFDAGFFGFTPREAELTDPQHRLFLECAWEALESAGHDPDRFPGTVGVYAGASMNGYLLHNLLRSPGRIDAAAGFQVLTGNDKDYLATRVSYKLNLRGPSLSVQTACSTSLVAVHLASESLLNRECDMALAGGVAVSVPQVSGYRWFEGGIFSPDGHCRTFDAAAQGTLFGSGLGVVVLRRLEDALTDGDPVRAVLLGSAVNNDGSRKVGFTAPGVEGQARVISEALAVAGVEAETIGYVEAHGTATPMGDPIEVEALTRAYATDRRGFCALGSVKTNFGHLETAAGVAGLIKTVLALENGQIPPSLHFESPNPRIDFAATPFRVNAALTPWPRGPEPRRAGVSSFGIGGTNAHVVLEEAPPPAAAAPSRPEQLLLLSARTPEALEAAARRLHDHLEAHPEENLADVAHTLQVGRRAFEHRSALVCRGREEALAALAEPGRLRRVRRGEPRGVVMLFPGQGVPLAGAGAGLYRDEAVFREELDRCAAILVPLLGLDLRTLLLQEASDEARALLARTRITQPVLFAVEYALARVWESWGIRPRAMIGHSLGEYVAACLAGVLPLADALALVAARGRLMQDSPAGAMLGVPLPESDVLGLLGTDLSLAAVNAPDRCVVAGPEPAVEVLEARLAGVATRRLPVSHAFHTAAMAAVARPFLEALRRVRLRPPEIPFLSNVTGTWIRAEEATDPQYWVRHLLQTVRFADGIGEVLQEPSLVLLEVGPGRTLGDLARRHPRRTTGHTTLASLPTGDGDATDLGSMLDALGRAWQAGVEVDWAGFYRRERRRRVVLPSYPFERRRYWIEPEIERPAAEREAPAGSRPGPAQSPDDLFWVPVWTEAPLAPADADTLPRSWLVIEDDLGIGAELARRLREQGREVAVLREPADPETLLAAVEAGGPDPLGILHLGLIDGSDGEAGFFSLLALGQALGRRAASGPVQLRVVASGLADVTGDEPLRPGAATALGPCRVIPLELPEVSCRVVDILASGDEAARRVFAELGSGAPEPLVAWRGRRRWAQRWQRIPLPRAESSPLRPAGVYLITGGLGGVGLAIARHLARAVRARLALVGRRALPPRDEWSTHLDGRGETARRIAAVLDLESLGAEVMTVAADVTDAAGLKRAVAAARERFGALHGVVHAAGIAGGGVLQTRTREAAAEVLAPKVEGTRALAAALEGLDLDFLALFSSILGFTGGFGQVDYAAANAYLDAFARARAAAGDAVTVAIDWDLWREVGMARSQRAAREDGSPGEIRRLASGADREVFALELVAGEDWLLTEHRVLGRAVLPGTALLEIARAAVATHAADGEAVELRDVILLAPVAADEGELVELRVILEPAGEGFAFRVASLAEGAPAGREHARGSALLIPKTARRLDPDRLLPGEAREVAAAQPVAGPVEWGPRWRSLRRVLAASGTEAVAWLELPEPFLSDLGSFVLHPALLDVATGYVNQVLGGGVYLPLSYESLRVEGPLPARLLSHARRQVDEPGETLTVDLTLLDEDGGVRVEISGFTLRRVDPAALERAVAAEADGPGLSAREGGEAFERVLAAVAAAAAGSALPQVAVSRRDLTAAVEGSGLPVAAAILERPAPARHPRPEIGTPYEPPRNEVEQGLVGIWQERLGIDLVGIHDNFFELGGDSVLAIQILTAAHDTGLRLRPNDLFRHPTVAGLAEIAGAPAAPILVPEAPAAVQDRYPLSPMQQGMLFHTLYAPDSAVYVEQFACTLRGDLDADAFERAWQRAAERHDILRTAFEWQGVEEPRQMVLDRVALALERLDWRGLDPEEQRLRLERDLAVDRERGFDLLAPPLMRLTLIHTGERAWRFVWRFHHLLLDGWSGNLLLGEVFHLYESIRRGQEPRLPPVRPFRDYIAWLGRQDLAHAEAFWRRALAGFTAPTPLVVDRPSTAPGDGEAYGKLHTAFSEEETEALARLARSSQVTLATLVEGAWGLLLARYSREPEVVFGATSSGRPVDLPGVEGMVGLFVNTLPARVEAPLAAPLFPWLRRLQEQQAEMREYEHSPLAQVQSWSDVPAGTPLFESIQGLENYPVSRWGGAKTGSLVLEDLQAYERTNYPLTVLASPGSSLSLEIWFERRRFDPATVERMLGHLRTLLVGFLEADRQLGELPLLTASERAQALAAEAGSVSLTEGVQEAFEAQVERTPDAVALLGEGESLTYRQLNAAANRMAWRLRSLGVGPEDLVGVSAASPLRMVVAILGVLKAGAAYLPLDPGYPRERLAFILETAGTRVLVADPGLLPLSEEEIARIDCVPPDGESEENPPALASGAHSAYAIFTSGSTGQPKGIVVPHEPLLHLSRSFIAALGLGPGERLLMVPSLSFDASVGDVFPALLSGAALVVHPAPSDLAPEELIALCEDLGVTVVDIPAAFWNAWAEALAASPRPGLLSGLRLVIAGGESIAPDRVERWAAVTGRRVTFFGPYGPTEATVCTTAYATVDGRGLLPGSVRLPIGRPLPHAHVRLLDPGMEPVPVLVPGEIAIGGAGLARGYLGRPDLTAERFMPDPFAAAPGERLYRTGDLALRLPDGNLEFAGRVDQQIKLRGYRIETGEIEAVLLRHPAVREAVVAAREDKPGDKRLVAYVVPEPDGLPEGDDPWQPLFEESYAEEVAKREETVAAALVNFAGWNSSATGQPISVEEMREWADRTAERILALRPRRVLEIGCGTGLLLLRVAPTCDAYVGADFSAAALDYLARVLESAEPPIPGVELRQRPADDWRGVEPESFDVVVLSSVVQYFPGVAYLREVLRNAVAAVRPGGAVFLGDLRSLPLLPAFHAAVERTQAGKDLDDAELASRVARRVALERELAVDPGLFGDVARELPRIGRVEVQLKRGRADNELTRFRYDVTLHVGPQPATGVRPASIYPSFASGWRRRRRQRSRCGSRTSPTRGSPAPGSSRRTCGSWRPGWAGRWTLPGPSRAGRSASTSCSAGRASRAAPSCRRPPTAGPGTATSRRGATRPAGSCPRCASCSSAACPTTWCPRRSSCSRRCPSPRTARSTAAPCRPRTPSAAIRNGASWRHARPPRRPWPRSGPACWGSTASA